MWTAPRRTSSLGIAALAFVLGGCGGVDIVTKPIPPPSGTRLSFYAGPECDLVRESEDTAGRLGRSPENRKKVDYDPRLHALLAVCDRSTIRRNRKDYGRGSDEPLVTITPFDPMAMHHGFTGRPLTPIQTALFVLHAIDGDAASDASVQKSMYESNDVPGLRLHRSVVKALPGEKEALAPPKTHGILGLAAMYAKLTDRAALQRDLEQARVPPGAAAVFLERFDMAREFIDERVARMPRIQREVFVEVPFREHRARQVYFELHRALYERLEELAEDARAKATPDLAAKLVALRSEYTRTCSGEDCTYEPFYMAVTSELLLTCIKLKDVLCAYAEDGLLHREDAVRGRFANVVVRAQWKAALPSREAYELLQKTKKKDLDEATTKALLGDVEPVLFKQVHFVTSKEPPPSYADLLYNLNARPEGETGVLASVRKKGNAVLLTFKSEHHAEERFDCRPTGRLEGVGSDGELRWGERCQTRTRQVPLPGPDPVLVPTQEAAGLTPGELTTVLVARGDPARNALVVSSYKGKTLVQLRGDRLTGPR